MLYLYGWKDKPLKDKVKDVAKMVAFVIIATTAIAILHGIVNHAADKAADTAS